MHIEGSNPGLEYHFLSPEKTEVSPDQVEWKIGKWGMCSEDCAGGNYIVKKIIKRKKKQIKIISYIAAENDVLQRAGLW